VFGLCAGLEDAQPMLKLLYVKRGSEERWRGLLWKQATQVFLGLPFKLLAGRGILG
jgi:hypothetical protein